jgi:hypothetical protein
MPRELERVDEQRHRLLTQEAAGQGAGHGVLELLGGDPPVSRRARRGSKMPGEDLEDRQLVDDAAPGTGGERLPRRVVGRLEEQVPQVIGGREAPGHRGGSPIRR